MNSAQKLPSFGVVEVEAEAKAHRQGKALW
jgi:hypothetical protein